MYIPDEIECLFSIWWSFCIPGIVLYGHFATCSREFLRSSGLTRMKQRLLTTPSLFQKVRSSVQNGSNSHNSTFTVNRSWNKLFYYTPKPIRLRFSMAGFKMQLWQIVWPAAELGNCFDWFKLLSTSIIELNETCYVWMSGTIELLDVISTVFNKRGIMFMIMTDKYKVIFRNLFVFVIEVLPQGIQLLVEWSNE